MAYTAKHFNKETDPKLFACPCGRPACDAPGPSDRLLEVLDGIRDQMQRPVIVQSGPRCTFWNEKVGGENPSAHLFGEAADVQCVLSSDRFEMIDVARSLGVLRYGIGSSFLHVDTVADPRFPVKVAWHYYGVLRRPEP